MVTISLIVQMRIFCEQEPVPINKYIKAMGRNLYCPERNQDVCTLLYPSPSISYEKTETRIGSDVPEVVTK